MELDILDYVEYITQIMLRNKRLAGTKKVRKITINVIDELIDTGRKLGLKVNFNLERKVFIIQ